MHRAAKYQKRGYLPRLNEHKYKIKDPVWYWLPISKKNQVPKLASFWDGPYFIIKVYSDVLYLIQKSNKHKSRVVHHNQLKPCKFREKENTSWIEKLLNTETPKKFNKETVKEGNKDKNDISKALLQTKPKRTLKPVQRFGDWFYDF